jgi:cob(I)alamin adenosyltransferase
MKSYQDRKPGDEGDGGETGRLGGSRVRKCHPTVIANGEVDELNAHLGLCLVAAGASYVPPCLGDVLRTIQPDLMALGSMLAAEPGADPPAALDEGSVARIEAEIAATAQAMPNLTHFLLPGGCELAARLHVARAVCRRAERAVVRAVDEGISAPPVAVRYLNRLSDLLFELARAANCVAGVEDRPWRK